MRKRILLISLAVVLALSVGLVGCTEPVVPEVWDTLVLAKHSLAHETFLPWTGGAIEKSYLGGTIYEPLTLRDREGNLEPCIATDWEMSEDGMAWTVTIRGGVEFHEEWGVLNSTDVKYTFERLMGDDSVSHIKAGLVEAIASIETSGPNTVVFNMAEPNVAFMVTYSSADMMGVVCKAYVEEEGDVGASAKPIGTGPYTKNEHVPGAHIILRTIEDVEDHWRIIPDFEYLKFMLLPEVSARVIGLLAGEIHFSDIGTEVVPEIEAGEGVSILNQHQYQAATDLIRLGGQNKVGGGAFYDPTNPWTDETPVGETTAGALVRQAMNYAIDKTALVNSIYEGVGGVAPVPIGVAQWLADLDPYYYDPTTAMDLLDTAGYGDGFDVILLEDARYSHSLNALAVAAYWEDIGLTVTIETHTWPDIRGRWATGALSHGYAWCHRTPPASVDPLLAINMGFNPYGVLADYSDEATETYRTGFSAELDLEVRADILDDFGEYVNAMATQVFLVNIFTPVAVSDLLDEPRDMYDLNEHPEYIERK